MATNFDTGLHLRFIFLGWFMRRLISLNYEFEVILLVNAVALSMVRAGIVLAAINVGINRVDFTAKYSEF